MPNAPANWYVSRRLDWIDILLATAGQVNRDDLVQRFGVSASQASVDLRAFEAAHPGAARYDHRAKCYVPSRIPYRRRRKLSPVDRETLTMMLAE